MKRKALLVIHGVSQQTNISLNIFGVLKLKRERNGVCVRKLKCDCVSEYVYVYLCKHAKYFKES